MLNPEFPSQSLTHRDLVRYQVAPVCGPVRILTFLAIPNITEWSGRPEELSGDSGQRQSL